MPRFRLASLFVVALASVALIGSCKKENKEADPKVTATTVEASRAEAPADAASAAPEVPKDEPPVAHIEKPFFFRVTGPNEAAGYLLGTMHMGIDAAKEFPKNIWEARDAATIVAVEADISDMSLAMGLMLPPDTNLKALLGDEYWAKLEAAIGPAQAQSIMPMKPAVAVMMLEVKGMDLTLPAMDLLIATKAKEAKQDLQFLESAQFQLDLLNKVMTIEYLKEMLDKPEEEDEGQKMLDAYRAGDLAALEEMSEDPEAWGGEAQGPVNKELMLTKRNQSWLPKLETMFASKSAFVAVGAAHLVGPEGVIELLRKKGYTVERIPAAE